MEQKVPATTTLPAPHDFALQAGWSNEDHSRCARTCDKRDQLRSNANMTSDVMNQLRFAAIMTNNSQQCPSVRNMGDMSTSCWESVQHEEQ